jgi:hypothetical protein
MLPAKKLGEGDVMSFPRLAALSTLALACSFVADAARPATAASEPRIIRIGAVVDQTGGSTSPLYGLLWSWRQAK